MTLFTPSRFLVLFIVALLASCRSEQIVFQLTAPPKQQVALVGKPSELVYEASTTASTKTNSQLLKPTRKATSAKVPKANITQLLRQSATVTKRMVRPRLINKSNTAAVRGVREEGEGKPALLVLGILLVVAGIAGGFLIGGGIGFFVGLPIGLLGYYFFMKGLLGPNAWIEVANELFQL